MPEIHGRVLRPQLRGGRGGGAVVPISRASTCASWSGSASRSRPRTHRRVDMRAFAAHAKNVKVVSIQP